jgi:type I restriction enzyme S subunit
MFGDPVHNPKGWPLAQLSELTQIWSGSTPSRKDPAHYGGTIPWVKTTEVDGRVIIDTEEKVTEKGFASARLKLFPPSSLVVALYGQGKTRGRCALLGIHSTTNQACGVLMPTGNFEPAFQLAQLSLSYSRLRALGQGGNQPNLNLGLLGSFCVLNPPLPLQRLFASRAAGVDKIARSAAYALKEGGRFFDCLQFRAFRGEL